MVTSTRWIELSLAVDRESVEAVAEVFRRYGCGGVAIEEPLEHSPNPEDTKIAAQAPLTIRTYLPMDESSAQKRQEIDLRLRLLSMIRPLPALEERELSEEDWANAWKAFFPVHRVGRVVIKPSWLDYQPQPDEVVVQLDPGMAFGTGLHPTTRRCLEVMPGLVKSGTTVLDVGTGSGILSLSAAKLGAARVLALDIEPQAVQAAIANARDNRLEDVITVHQGTLPLEYPTTFALVLANISARAITGLAQQLVAALVPGGHLIAAGFLDTQMPGVREALEKAGAQITEVFSDEDWRTLVVRRSAF